MTTREGVHRLLDELPEALLPVAEDSMRRIMASAGDDEFWKRLEQAPVDDEPLAEREREALRRFDAGRSQPTFFSEQELEQFLAGERA